MPVPSLPLIGRRTVDKQLDAAMFFLAAAIYTAPHLDVWFGNVLGIICAGVGWYVMHMEKNK